MSQDLNGGESTYQGAKVYRCKSHGYSHAYTVHSCGCNYCAGYWLYCPRCFGRDESNHPSARAISCSLETIADESIELLSFIDQPNYSTALYVIGTKEIA